MRALWHQRKRFQALSGISPLMIVLAAEVLPGADLYWDISESSGFQSGNGIWSTGTNNWSSNGTSRISWPSSGENGAFFTEPGDYIVTVNGSVNSDSISFLAGSIAVNSGTINLQKSSITVPNSFSATISSVISGSSGLVKNGTGTLILTADNSYSGTTVISDGTLQIGTNGSSGSVNNGRIVNNGTLTFNKSGAYVFSGSIEGDGTLIKRGETSLTLTGDNSLFTGTTIIEEGMLHIGQSFTTGSLGGNIIINSNSFCRFNRSDSVIFTGNISGTGSFTKWGTGRLILTGNNTFSGGTLVETGILQIGMSGSTGSIIGDIEIDSFLVFKRADHFSFDGTISGNGMVIQAGTGILTFSADHTYSGTTLVFNGTMELNGSISSGSTVLVNTGATLSGNGHCEGKVTVSPNGTLSPGGSGTVGTLFIDTLVQDAASYLLFDLGASSDTLKLGSGNHHLAGTVSISSTSGFTHGTYRLVTFTGSLDDGSHHFVLGTVPERCGYAFTNGADYIDLVVTLQPPLCIGQSADTTLYSGETAVLSVSAQGEELSYLWVDAADPQTALSDSVSFILENLTTDDNGRLFYCIVANSAGSDTCDSITLTVLQPPSVDVQPVSDTVTVGDSASFFCTASGNPPLTYHWFKVDSDNNSAVASESLLIIPSTIFPDSGRYFCIVANDNGRVDTSDTVNLVIMHLAPVITGQPENDTVFVDGEALFSIATTGNAQPLLVWYKSGISLPIDSGNDLSIPTVSFSDSGDYFCVARNPAGTAVSDTVRLVVKHIPPAISRQPVSLAVTIGDSALFSVSASGNAPPAIHWFKTGSTEILSSTAALFFEGTEFSDSGSYYCIASNPAGDISSDTVFLTVKHIPPKITSQPLSLTAFVGDTVQFTVSAAGNAPPVFAWHKIGVDSAIASTATLSFTSLTTADRGRYYCTVSNPGGSVASDIVRLMVNYRPPVADFSMNPQSGLVPLTVTFNDLSTGVISNRHWYFGDGSDDTVLKPEYTYVQEGLFTVTLVTEGPGGVDSMVKHNALFVYRPGANPVQLTARYLTGTDVEIICSNIDQINNPDSLHQYDSLGIWVHANTPPSSPDGAELSAVYHLSTFSGTQLCDTITLDPADSLYWLMCGLFRHDGSISDFAEGNGTSVLLRDTLQPFSEFAVTTEPLGGDSVRFILTVLDSLDTRVIDSLLIRYFYIDPDNPSFTDAVSVRSFKIPEMIAVGDTLVFIIHDSLFTGLTHQLDVHVSVKGKNDKISIPSTTSFTTIATVPRNLFRCSAELVSATSIRLNWNRKKTPCLDSVIIWYGTVEILPGFSREKLVGRHCKAQPVSLHDTSFVFKGLLSESEYFFGIQFRDGMVWSVIDSSAIARCTTPELDIFEGIKKALSIDTLFFDPLVAAIKVKLHVDSLLLDRTIDLGISYTLGKYADGKNPSQILPVTSSSIETFLQLNELLLFDTLYHLTFSIRTPPREWLQFPEGGQVSVRTGSPFRQVISLFSPSGIHDTLRVFNGTVLLWKDSTDTSATTVTDTIEMAESSPDTKGMIPLYRPVSFVKGSYIGRLNIAFKIPSLPKDIAMKNIRIYHEKKGEITTCYESIVDTSQQLVYLKTDQLHNNFLVMVDTAPPAVKIFSKTTSSVRCNMNVVDSLQIRDNIANVQWEFHYSKGSAVPSAREKGVLNNSVENLILEVPDSTGTICPLSGLRSLLIVYDGANRDTVDLSRTVYSDTSAVFALGADVWTPIYSTALSPDNSLQPVLDQLHPENRGTYNPGALRFFRWATYSGNKNSNNKWVEYNPKSTTIRSLFSLVPGRIIWMKAGKPVSFHFDSVTTLSLKDTFTLTLPSEEWTDFGMPYHFGVRLETILSASGKSAEDIYFYQWIKDDSSRLWASKPLYVVDIPDNSDPSVQLKYSGKGGYTLYNNSSKTVTLRIPPTLAEMSDGNNLSKRKKSTAWSVRFTARTTDGIALPPVYCAYAQGVKKKMIPSSPTFAKITVALRDRKTGNCYGHVIDEENRNGSVHEINISNATDSIRKITYRLDLTGRFPEEFHSSCYDASQQLVDTSGYITVAAQSSTSRWIITGDEAYHQSFLAKVLPLHYGLIAPYPNPARALVTIRYTVPLGAQEQLSIEIFSMLGKRIWNKRISGYLTEGIHLIGWNGQDTRGNKVGSGIYIIRLNITDTAGKVIKRFERQLTYLR